MKCMRCGEEMKNTIGGCYTCDNCGFGFDDCVLRYKTKDGKTSREANVIDSKDFGTLGAYFEADAAQKKIKELEAKLAKNKKWLASNEGFVENQQLIHQLAEKDELIEELKEQAEIWQKLLFEKMETQIVGVTNEKLKELRHQVCEEIRHKAKWRNPPSQLQFIISAKDLKQIEQGESK